MKCGIYEGGNEVKMTTEEYEKTLNNFVLYASKEDMQCFDNENIKKLIIEVYYAGRKDIRNDINKDLKEILTHFEQHLPTNLSKELAKHRVGIVR